MQPGSVGTWHSAGGGFRSSASLLKLKKRVYIRFAVV
jgi:hypothetical protein